MCKKLRASLFIMLLLLLAGGALAQAQPRQLGELNFMLGKWEGQGWNDFGHKDNTPFKVKQSVMLKAGGWAILIDGLGTYRFPGRQEEWITTQIFSVISYDWPEKRFHIHAYREIEGVIDGVPKVTGNTLVWEYQGSYPTRPVRVIIRLNEKGQWHETGEDSMDDGKTWRKFFEMILNRVP